jgi:hypothetical protein
LGVKTTTPRIINFTVLVEAFLLYITKASFNFSFTCAVVEKIFKNWSNLGSFCPTLKAPGGQGT